MKHNTTIKGFCPHQISTKIGSINLYRYTHDIDFVCRRYHISKASLMRWNKIYDGTRESLLPKSHRPHTPHPNAHTEEELKWIKDTIEETQIFQFVSFTENLERIKDIPAIPVLFTVFSCVLDSERK